MTHMFHLIVIDMAERQKKVKGLNLVALQNTFIDKFLPVNGMYYNAFSLSICGVICTKTFVIHISLFSPMSLYSLKLNNFLLMCLRD